MSISCLEVRTENRITDREMVHHLSLRGRDVEILCRSSAGQRRGLSIIDVVSGEINGSRDYLFGRMT
jgi:hypothetical protein